MKKVTIEISEPLKDIADQRGGADYIAAVLNYYIANYDTPNWLELKNAGIEPEDPELYKKLAGGLKRPDTYKAKARRPEK